MNQTLSLPFSIGCDSVGSKSLVVSNLNTGELESQITIDVYPRKMVRLVALFNTNIEFYQ